jgi:hypothetical protein
MLKTMIATLSCFSLFCLAACNAGAPKPAENPPAAPGAPAAPTPKPDISYGAGFSPMESAPDGATWRWMAESGSIELKNQHNEMRLKIAGKVPTDVISGPVKLTIKFNGETLDQFTATKEKPEFAKEFDIPAAKQTSGAYSQLTLESDKFFVPKLVNKESTDDRKLSFSLTKVEWTAK